MTPGSTRAIARAGVDLQDLVHVLRPVDDDGGVDRLPAQARARPPRDTMGAPKARHAATIATASSFDRGIATPSGSCR